MESKENTEKIGNTEKFEKTDKMVKTQRFDFIVVGSGFGGSVSALRLAQKGYRVAVLESGKRWTSKDFAETNWNLRKYLWMPYLGMYGIQRLNLLRDFFLVSGSGVGGGSLVYGATLYRPDASVLSGPGFAELGGEEALQPFYDIATYMLGVSRNPNVSESDRILKEIAEEMGVGSTFRPTPVGIFFGDGKGKGQSVPDPFFDGEGPDRSGCVYCGGCLVGCRYNAKNTLDRNYLFLAEKLGVTVIPETKAIELLPLNPEGKPVRKATAEIDGRYGWLIRTKRTTAFFPGITEFRADSVILSAGVMGTLGLLLKMKDQGVLPQLSDRLGDRVRTNSETVLAVTSRRRDADYSKGVAISSSFHPEEGTHIEPVRYPAGSDFFGLISSAMVDGYRFRALRFLLTALIRPLYFLRAMNPFGFARRSLILLVMQSFENGLRLVRRRRLIWPFTKSLTSTLTSGEPTPVYIPVANQVAHRVARKIDGFPRSSINDSLLGAPITGHIMGGCTMGKTAEEGVIDLENRVFGVQNLRVVDASMIPVNLGVNPSLTITALSERAMSLIPPKNGEQKLFSFEKRLQFDRWLTGSINHLTDRLAKKV
jgi:cholesterol oxidase